MPSDSEARNVVRQLMKRFDLINAQRIGFVEVLVSKDPDEYSRLWQEADEAIKKNIRPLIDAEHGAVYRALDDPTADWCKAVMRILDTSPRVIVPPQK